MKSNIKYILLSLVAIFLISSCVDDYKDANPKRALDSPAGNLQDPTVGGVKSTTESKKTYWYVKASSSMEIVVDVVDAPGLIGSATAKLTNSIQPKDFGEISADISGVIGKEKGQAKWIYKSGDKPGIEKAELSLSDSQEKKNKKTTKFSLTVNIVNPKWPGADCFSKKNLVGKYTAVTSGTNSTTNKPYKDLKAEVEFRINEGKRGAGVWMNHPGYYRLTDGSFGVYPQLQKKNVNFINVNVCDNKIINADEEFKDNFSGTINEDGTIKITWKNTAGDTGETIMTPKK